MTAVVLWFPEEGRDESADFVFYWQQDGNGGRGKRHTSLPRIIASDSEHWKLRYLKWLDKVGIQRQDNLMHKGPGPTDMILDYWWFTLPTEASFTEDSVPYAVVRLWAFVEEVSILGANAIEIIGAPQAIVETLRSWTETRGITLANRDHNRSHDADPSLQVARFSHSRWTFPQLRAGAYLARELARYALSASHSSDTRDLGDLVIVDYFANFTVGKGSGDEYVSGYWGRLPPLLKEVDLKVSWVHIDYRSVSAPSVREARKAIKELSRDRETHVLLQDLLSLRDLRTIWKRYLDLAAMARRCDTGKWSWLDDESGLDLSPLLRSRWREFFLGAAAMRNAIWLTLFAKLSKKTSQVMSCLYLMENQPWEMALLSCWRNAQGGPIYGVIHSTVRTWDTRFALPLMAPSSRSKPPSPDLILANGPVARESLIVDGYGTEMIRDVEALRYIDSLLLAKSTAESKPLALRTQVIIIADYDLSMALEQAKLANALAIDLSSKVDIVFREHPATSLPHSLLVDEVYRGNSGPISNELVSAKAAVCSAMSSARLDCLLGGVPVFVVTDPRFLDGSIAGSWSGSSQFVDLAALKIALLDVIGSPVSPPKDVMHLEPSLPRWRALLSDIHRRARLEMVT